MSNSDASRFWASHELILWSWLYSAPLTIGVGYYLSKRLIWYGQSAKHPSGNQTASSKPVIFLRTKRATRASLVSLFVFIFYIAVSYIPHVILAPIYENYAVEPISFVIPILHVGGNRTRTTYDSLCERMGVSRDDAIWVIVNYENIDRRLCVPKDYRPDDMIQISGRKNGFGLFIDSYSKQEKGQQ